MIKPEPVSCPVQPYCQTHSSPSKAFCEGVMDYKIYCTLPNPFCDMKEYAPHGPKNSLWLLISAIYGVKQAARQYFTAVVAHVTGPMKMIQSQRDPCVLMKWFNREEAKKIGCKKVLDIACESSGNCSSTDLVSFIIYGAWVDDKVAVMVDLALYTNINGSCRR